jgi:ribonuclease HI
MGVGWVQVDSNKEKVMDEGTISARNWPSSTKAELLAIWYVLLITPRKKKIKIYTDSAAAIAGLNRGKKLKSSKHWIKEKNYNLKRSILELLSLKELELVLVKVKGHSCNKWNDRADKLAKEEGRIDNFDRIIEAPPANSNVSLCWEDLVIESSTRKFIKNVLELKVGAE